MYLKMVWCYVFILTLLDISLNTKLTAQGKSHGTVQDQWMLIEKVHFQEYAKDSQPVPPDALRLWPASLQFGRAALARPAALTVTITNTANTTLHLASVAGTTPHFHASFFESKTLPPQANTTFTVVYLGRREGLVSAHLYIHTSMGVHKYPVSAEGVGNEFEVWPLVGVRVPLNATLEPLLTMRNPTDQTIQVTEVYSSSAWLGLQLPDGGQSAPRALWSLPPHSTVNLVRLRMTAPSHQPTQRGYIRIKANVTGGGLVVAVEARMTSQQEFLEPLQLRLRMRGCRDPPQSWDILAGSSSAASTAASARAWGARCAHAAFAPRHPLDEPTRQANGAPDHHHGVKSEGVHVTLLRPQLDAFQSLAPTVRLTLDFAKMWDSFVTAESTEMNGSGGGKHTEAWCSGFVRVGRAALPYSVRLVPGGLALLPSTMQFITANRDEVMKEQEVRVRNDYNTAVRLLGIEYDHELQDLFIIEENKAARLLIESGQTVTVARLALRRLPPEDAQLSSTLNIVSDISTHALNVRLAPGKFKLEWEWPNSADGVLRLGTLSTSSTRRVALRLRNTGGAALCVTSLLCDLRGGDLALEPHTNHSGCVEGGQSLRAWLVVVAPARAGALAGTVTVRSQHAAASARVTLRARSGLVRAQEMVRFMQGAPYAPASIPIQIHSTMATRMRVTDVTVPDTALYVTLEPDVEITAGTHVVGSLHYAPERLCEPHCYSGLDLDSEEGQEWAARLQPLAASARREALERDLALLERRLAAATRAMHAQANATVYVHTTEVVQIPVSVSVLSIWPRVWVGGAPHALCGVGGTRALRLLLRNPSQRALLLHARAVTDVWHEPSLEGWEEKPQCLECTWAPEAFTLSEWQVVKGEVRLWNETNERTERIERAERNDTGLPPLLMSPGAELELIVNFTPKSAAPLAAKLYLRNNLTILESVQVWGYGVYPSFELGGRRPGRHSEFMFEIGECGSAGLGVARRSVTARNTGRVPVLLRDWRLSGVACASRGFRLWPCQPVTLQPNESLDLTIAFQSDWTLARVPAILQVWTDMGVAEWSLSGRVPARLLSACHSSLPRAGWEAGLRASCSLVALLALALVLAAAALDAERELRRASAARPQVPSSRAPLDLRGVTAECRAEGAPRSPPPPPPPPPAPRRKRSRRPPQTLDPQAERRAFERWRAEVLRREDDHSSEDADAEQDVEDFVPPSDPDPEPEPDHPAEEFPAQPDEDVGSTGSDTSSPGEERDEPEDTEEVSSCVACPEAAAGPAAGEGGAAPPAPEDGPPPRARARVSASPPHRKLERKADGEPAPRARAPPRHHARKEKSLRRRGAGERGERQAAGGGGGGNTPVRARDAPADVRTPPALRRGATWSSVVAEGVSACTGSVAAPAPAPPLAPIGSDVRRRTERAQHSLFYFNDAAPGWTQDPSLFREDNSLGGTNNVSASNTGYGSIGSVWGAGAPLTPRAPPAWLWGSQDPVRPPPGFGDPARPAQTPRAYDPFRSLASIWGPGTLDWRRDPSPPEH